MSLILILVLILGAAMLLSIIALTEEPGIP